MLPIGHSKPLANVFLVSEVTLGYIVHFTTDEQPKQAALSAQLFDIEDGGQNIYLNLSAK